MVYFLIRVRKDDTRQMRHQGGRQVVIHKLFRPFNILIEILPTLDSLSSSVSDALFCFLPENGFSVRGFLSNRVNFAMRFVLHFIREWRRSES